MTYKIIEVVGKEGWSVMRGLEKGVVYHEEFGKEGCPVKKGSRKEGWSVIKGLEKRGGLS